MATSKKQNERIESSDFDLPCIVFPDILDQGFSQLNGENLVIVQVFEHEQEVYES